MTDDERTEFEAARAAGLKARHETRVERAREREATNELCESVAAHMSSIAGIYYVPQTSTDEAYDKLARAAVDVVHPAARRQVAQEIAEACERDAIYDTAARYHFARIAREIGTRETS